MISELEKCFKALGEPTRLKIIKLLAERELCVCELVEILQISQPRVSQHLRALKIAGLVSERKEQQWIISMLDLEKVNKMRSMFDDLIGKPIDLLDEFKEEARRLKEVASISRVINCKSQQSKESNCK